MAYPVSVAVFFRGGGIPYEKVFPLPRLWLRGEYVLKLSAIAAAPACCGNVHQRYGLERGKVHRSVARPHLKGDIFAAFYNVIQDFISPKDLFF